MVDLVNKIKRDYPSLNILPGLHFGWSPKTRTITYRLESSGQIASWSLLHELAHACLDHNNYETDLELLLLEVAAWGKAKELAHVYAENIDEDHTQDCIDTYRDWLYQRSTCPTCSTTSLQHNSVTYRCFNCETSWTVTSSRFCRPYRLTTKQQKTPPAIPKDAVATFL